MFAPAEFTMLSAYPNPFNPTTALSFELKDASFVELAVYDITGREVATLLDGWTSAGSHEISWSAENLPSGVYFASLTANNIQHTQKLLLVK